MDSAITIDNFGPLPVHRPTSVPELCRLVKEAAASGQGIYPVGGRTTLDVGLPPTKPGLAIDTTGLADVIDYPARDMTITVQAGMTIAKLQETLASAGQWLPVDVAAPNRATIGGAVALNKSGPHRYGHGTLRDYVIGISFVTDEGHEVKGGGRVVKNVAGYDLMKLQIGAVGTLGVVTQLTLKVKPKPEAATALTLGCDAADLGAVLDLLHASRSRPVAVEAVNAAAWRAAGQSGPEAPWVIAVGLAEKTATLSWQQATLLEELKAAPFRAVSEIADAAALWQTLTDLQIRPESRLIGKANVLPSKVAEVLGSAPLDASSPIHAEALNGIIWFHSPDQMAANSENSLVAWMDRQVSANGGNSTVRRCPVEWKRSLPVWGRPSGPVELMRHVKQTLDPHDLFNPGRLFG